MLFSSAVAAQAAPSIPYRTTPAVPASSVASSAAIVTAILVALVVAAVYARRRGWLAKLGANVQTPSVESVQVGASCRLSVSSTAYVLRYRGREFLVVESARGTNAAVAPLNGDQPVGVDS